jgi:hypothetical protein
MVYKVDYRREYLIIRRLVIAGHAETGGPSIRNTNISITSPLINRIELSKSGISKIPDMNGSWFVNHVIGVETGKIRWHKVTVHRNADRQGPFRITKIGDDFIFSFDEEFFKKEIRIVIEGPAVVGQAGEV